MTARGGKVVAKLVLDSSEFTSGWKKAFSDLGKRIVGPDLSGVKKDIEEVGQLSKKTAADVKEIDNTSTSKVNASLQSTINKLQEMQKAAKPVTVSVKPANIDETIRKIKEMGSQSKKTEEEVKQINNSRFDKLVSNLDGVINKMRSTVSSGVTTIRNDINSGINAVNFNNLSNKFSATIQRMQSTASAGVKSIANEFSGMEAGLTDIFATVAGGAGLQQIFTYGMGRATTQTMLQNSKSPQDASTIMEQYQKYTVASSTQDQDIQRVLKYVIQGAPPNQTYRSLSAIDAAAFTPDPIQRQELLRNYGQYLTSGYSAALFRGDVTPEEAKILEAAKTPEQRIAAMETIAKNKGSMTETGENLSTLTTGPMANYNKALIIADTLLRGMTDGFNKFMDAISPLMDWFIALDPKTQNTIGNLIFFAGILGMAGGAIKILGSVFSPFIGILKGVGSGALQVAGKLKDMIPTDKITSVLGKLKDAAGNGISSVGDKVVEGLSGLKDRVSGPMTSFKDTVIGKFNDLKDWIESKWKPQPSAPSTTPTATTTPQQGGLFGVPAATIAGGLGSIMVVGGAAVAGGYGLKQINDLLGGDHSQLLSSIGLQGPLGTGPGAFAGAMIGGEQMSFLDFLRAGVPGIGVMGTSYDTIKKLLPGTSSAAGGGTGKKSVTDDIFGEKGVLRGTPLAGLKWPTPQQILEKIKSVFMPKIPGLNWKLPTITSIGNYLKDKIPELGWKIPTLSSVGQWVQDKIGNLDWLPRLPSLNDVKNFVTDKVGWLDWLPRLPTLEDIKGIISSRIPGFSWPWGPGGGTRAANTATTIGSRASALLNSRGPRGPINDTIVSTMSARSGVGSGYISQALANRFSGLAGFNPIADGMAAPLSYEFYMGGQKSNQQVWDSGTCNCYDGAEFLQAEAGARFGLGAGLANGVWNGTSIPHTWSVIGGQPFDMAAKLIRGHWNPPSGPGSRDFAQFMTDIGPALEYVGYGGHRKDPFVALDEGGNCFDMTLGLMNIASGLFNQPTEMVWGTYDDGNAHVWLRAGGVDYDPTRRALASTYSPPPQGPGPSTGNGETHVHIHYDGEVYGFEDFETKTKAMVNKGLDERTQKKNRTRFGG